MEVDHGQLCITLNGSDMIYTQELYAEFACAFNFPSYFGRGMNALTDMLTDLVWLEFDNIELTIKNSNLLLVGETPEDRRVLMEVLADVTEYWAEPIQLGELWDHPALQFKVIYQP